MTSKVFALLAAGVGDVLSPAGPRARLAVFTYHQVLEHRDPLRPDEPDRAEFRRDLEIIGRVFKVLPLAEAARRLEERTLPARAACITFDDGYANNHELAAPSLEAAGLPATFFIACGAIDDGVMWNDLLIQAIEARPGALVLDALAGIETGPLAALRGAAAVRALLGALKYQPLERRFAVARQFYIDNVGAALPRLMMSRSEVADLARRKFDVGGHTVRHPILKLLGDEEARQEIESCSAWIASVTGKRPVSFAYPNGRPGVDFTERDAVLVADAGYTTAVSTQWGVARAGTNPFSVPRVGPWWRLGHSLSRGMLRLQLGSYRPRSLAP